MSNTITLVPFMYEQNLSQANTTTSISLYVSVILLSIIQSLTCIVNSLENLLSPLAKDSCITYNFKGLTPHWCDHYRGRNELLLNSVKSLQEIIVKVKRSIFFQEENKKA